jgi:hypothetical protein
MMEATMVKMGLNPATTPITSMMNYMTYVAEPSDEADVSPDWVEEESDA